MLIIRISENYYINILSKPILTHIQYCYLFQETSDITIEEEEDVNENSLPFLNTPVPDAALHAASILKELGYENIAIYPGGTLHI